MLKKYAIDYTIHPQHNHAVCTHFTDDPIEAEDFLMHLLVARARIGEIRHDGVALIGLQYDRLLRIAAERIASAMLLESLVLDPSAVKARFGLAI